MDAPFPAGMLDCIAKFFETEDTRVRGLDIYHEVFETELFFPLQRQTELAWMMRQAREIQPHTIFEIGSDKGGGLYHWIKCLPSVDRVIACEIRGTPYRELFQKAFPGVQFLWLEESSYTFDCRDKVARWLAFDSIDCLFIDGDKAEFERDYDVYLRYMNPKGRVFMHDVTDPAPGDAFDRVVNRGCGIDYIRFINRDDTHAAMRRAAEGIPPTGSHEAWLRQWNGQSCGVGMIKLGS